MLVPRAHLPGPRYRGDRAHSGRCRRRQEAGGSPKRCLNAREKWNASQNPQRLAISARPARECASRRAAASSRSCCAHAAGLSCRWAAVSRCRVAGLTPAARASSARGMRRPWRVANEGAHVRQRRWLGVCACIERLPPLVDQQRAELSQEGRRRPAQEGLQGIFGEVREDGVVLQRERPAPRGERMIALCDARHGLATMLRTDPGGIDGMVEGGNHMDAAHQHGVAARGLIGDVVGPGQEHGAIRRQRHRLAIGHDRSHARAAPQQHAGEDRSMVHALIGSELVVVGQDDGGGTGHDRNIHGLSVGAMEIWME